jgi:signal transduction histidine kinase/ActR/RegA family two-component response regulator
MPPAADPSPTDTLQPAAAPPAAEDRALVLAPVGRDAALTCELLTAAGIACRPCADAADLAECVRAGAATVILAEEALAAAAGKLHAALAAAPAWSDLPIVLMTTRAGGWESALGRLGERANVTLLERPVRAATLVRAVRAGLSARRRQYEVRDLVARLEGAVAERDRFLAMLGHELRNPLSAVVNTVELLEESNGDATAADRHQYHQIISRQSRQLARLVDDLLDVSRVSAGKIALQARPVDLVELVRQSYDLILGDGRCGHDCTFEAPDGPVVVLGDPTRLEQIAANLMTNAAKYTPAGGAVHVVVRADRATAAGGAAGGWAVLRVTDTGIGISPEDLPNVFDLFVQVDESLDRSQGGLGLGLTLVKSLTAMHGGRVAAFSDGDGKGSTFEIRLPLHAAAPAVEPARPSAASAASAAAAAAARRVMVVEDNPDNRRIMERLIRLWGHEVQTAADGPEGVALAAAMRPEVALVDIGLPGLDGYQVARQIRERLGASVHLVALTGYGQPEDRRRTAEAGFDEHLVKPVEPERLRRLLAAIPAGAAQVR